MESLPAVVRKRVRALKKLQDKHREIDNEFEEEIRQLELKYHQKHTPLWQKRAAIIAGEVEPTEEEAGPEEESEVPKIEEIKEEEKLDESTKGIPDFWLTALQNNQYFEATITEKDADALKFLSDISFEYLPEEPWSFVLIFKFTLDNPFLESHVIKKTYHIKKEDDGESVCETIDATELLWKEGKNLLQDLTGGLADEGGSFFLFFTPPEIKGKKPAPEIVDKMNLDFMMAVELKDKIIPGAIRWWTGEALMDEDDDDDFGEDEEDDGEDEDYHSDEDEDWTPPAGGESGGQDAPAPECKQQ